MKQSFSNIKNIQSNTYRLDSSYYLSEGISLRNKLDNVPYKKVVIQDITENVFLGNIFSRIFVNDNTHGIPYLAASDTVLSNHNTGRFIAKRQAQELKHLILEKDWIVITCSGTIGNVTYTDATFENHLATHDLIRVIANDEYMLRGCLYAFLASKYGYYQLTQSRFGGVVKHINSEHVNNIALPLFPKDFQVEIDYLIKKSRRLREEANSLLDQAKKSIIEYCATPFRSTHNYKIKSLAIKDIHQSFNLRFNPTFFINDGVEWVNNCRLKFRRLGDCNIKIWYPGIFKRTYVKDGLPYIKGSALFLRNPFKNCDMLSKTKTPNLNELWLKEGMVLISCAGLCGEVKIITREYEEKQSIGSPDIIRLNSSDELYTNEYIFACLQIPQMFEYMQSLKYGSVIERFDSFNVENIPIVVPDNELSITVTKLIKEYMKNSYEAFTAEEKAISLVEQEIEKWNN